MSTPETQPAPEDSSDAEPLRVGAGFDFSDPNSPLARFYLRSSHVAAIAWLAVVFIFFGVVTPLAHTDIWGHLKYGEWIVTHRALPERELFSPFSDPNQPYFNFQWLAQAIFYLVYHGGDLRAGGGELNRTAGGVEMLRSLHGLLITLKVAFVMLAIRRSTNSLPLAIAGSMVLVLLTMEPSRIQRPQVFGEVFFAFLIWWGSGSRLSGLTWLVVPLLFVVWANCHGSFAVGLVFLVLLWFGRMVEIGWNRSRGAGHSWWRHSWTWQGCAAIFLAPVAVGLLNPHGFEIYSNLSKLAGHPNISTIGEWMPLDFSQAYGAYWIYLATMVLLLCSQAVSPRPLPFARLVVLLAFGIGPLYQQRMLIWWLMLTPWFLSSLWESIAALVPRFWGPYRSVASLRKTLVAVCLILIGLSWSGLFQAIIGRDPLPLSSSVTHATLWRLAMELKHGRSMPALEEALKEYPNKRFTGRMFVQDSLADFLLWSLPEKAPLLVYNHAHVFPEAIWQDQLTVLSGAPGWASVLDRHQVNLIVMDPVVWPDLADKLRNDPEWNLILDEAEGAAGEPILSAANMKLMIAVRRKPIG